MNLRKISEIGAATLLLLAVLGGGLAWADGQSGDLKSKAGELKKKGAEQANKAGPVFQLPDLYAMTANLMSGSSWLALTGKDPFLRFQGKPIGELGSFPLVQGQVLTAPVAPPSAPPSQGVGPGLVPFRDPAPAFSRNLLLTRDFSALPYQTEPHIAVDPKDPDHLVMSTIDYSFPGNSSYVSIDGGETWQGPFQAKYVRDDLGAGGDPVVAFDREGAVHTIGISIGFEEFAIGPLVAFVSVSGISIASSEDGGFTWSEPVDTARSRLVSETFEDEEGRIRGDLAISFLDKPWLATGPDPDDPGRDNLYITYTRFEQQFKIFYVGEQPFMGLPSLKTSIHLVRSEDGGQTWSDPVNASPSVLLEFGARGSEAGEAGTARKRIVQGSQPQVAVDGTLYVTWLDTTDDDSQKGLAEIYVARSLDGGQTFQEPVPVAAFNEPSFSPRNATFRYWGTAFPQIATGAQGEVYVVYTALPPDKTLDDGDIYVVRSLDRGLTWSNPKRLNGDETERLQFFPSIATSPNGTLHVMWGDMRDDPAETRYHIYYTRSEDEGETWGFDLPELGIQTPDTRVTDFPSNPNKGFPGGQFIGDYFSIAATDEDAYLVWADTRLGEFGALNQKIGFTRQRPISAPQVFISPPAGPGGESITIQGFNFQPNMNYFVRVGGVTVKADRTGDDGHLSTQVFIPISGKGAHNVEVFDESGNFATASFFMEFGFDNIKETQDNILKELQELRAGLADGKITALPPSNSTSTSPADSDGTAPPAGAGASSAFPAVLVGAFGVVTLLGLLLAQRRQRPLPGAPGTDE